MPIKAGGTNCSSRSGMRWMLSKDSRQNGYGKSRNANSLDAKSRNESVNQIRNLNRSGLDAKARGAGLKRQDRNLQGRKHRTAERMALDREPTAGERARTKR